MNRILYKIEITPVYAHRIGSPFTRGIFRSASDAEKTAKEQVAYYRAKTNDDVSFEVNLVQETVKRLRLMTVDTSHSL